MNKKLTFILALLLLIFCQVTFAQTFNGTLRVHPENKRYFTDNSGKAIYLTGSHTWANFQDIGLPNDQPFDWTAYLDMMQANQHNFIRLWVWEQAKKAAWSNEMLVFSPLPYQTVERNGKQYFDLMQWNEAYFSRLRERIQAAKDRGIYVSVMLFQGWALNKSSIRTADPWEFHPFNPQNNIQGVGKKVVNHNQDDEQKPTLHAMGNGDVLAHQERYVQKVIETVNGFDNVLFEIINEGGTKEWQYHLIRHIKKVEAKLPKKHPVGMTHAISITPTMWNQDLLDSPADWISPADEPLDWKYANSSYLTNYRTKIPDGKGQKVIVLDTDHLWGCGGDLTWVWKSFLQGANPIYMDPWTGLVKADTAAIKWLSPCLYDKNDPAYVKVRQNMGYTRAFSMKIDLVKSKPMPELASSGFCLAHPSVSYVVWAEKGQFLTLNLRNVTGEYAAEWFNPETGKASPAEALKGGDYVVLKAPFDNDAVLFLKRR